MLWDFSEGFFKSFPQNTATKVFNGVVIRLFLENLSFVHPSLSQVSFSGNYYIATHPMSKMRLGAHETFHHHDSSPLSVPLGFIGSMPSAVSLDVLNIPKNFPIEGNLLSRIAPIQAPPTLSFQASHGEVPAFKCAVTTLGNVRFQIFQRAPFPKEQPPKESITPSLRHVAHELIKEGSLFFMNIGDSYATAH